MDKIEILVGVGGSIAAYKACDVVSDLSKRGAAVTVLMTKAAARFASPLALKVLSGRPVGLDLFEEPAEWGVGHVTLAKRARAFLIVGATADLLAKLDLGLADDWVTTCALVARCPMLLAPAMNTRMWEHPAVQRHVASLRHKGARILEPAEGLLACGDEGPGKLADPRLLAEEAWKAASAWLSPAGAVRRDLGSETGSPSKPEGRDLPLEGLRVLVTAGPTREPLDPVRFLSNPSSGRMGFAVAEAAARAGAQVQLVSGPTDLPDPEGVEVTRVTTALEMLEAVRRRFDACDALVAAAAVSDYRPLRAGKHKIKKGARRISLQLAANPDILLEMSRRKGKRALVGFAAETQNLLEQARQKLKRKKLDLIVANEVGPGVGFASEGNQATLIFADGRSESLPWMPKDELARRLVAELARLLGRAA